MNKPRGYSLAWLAAAGVAFAADLFLHLPVTDVFDYVAKRFGFFTYDGITRNVFVAIGCLCLVIAWAWPSGRRVAVGTATTVLVVIAGLAQTYTLVAGIENIHYPQYALLALLLARGLPSTEAAWLAATGLGFLDEAYQFLALPRGTPDYLDWNDIVLNAMGAAFGVIIVVAFTRARAERPVLSRNTALTVAAVCVVLAFALSPPVTPFFTLTPGGRPFHILAASEAAVILVLLWFGTRSLLRGSRGGGGAARADRGRGLVLKPACRRQTARENSRVRLA